MFSLNFQTLAVLVCSVIGLLLILKQPVWGIILIVGLDSMVDLLPNIPLLSSVLPLVGVITLGAFLLIQFKYREPFKQVGNFTASLFYIFFFSIFIAQYAFNVPNRRNWVLTYLQLFILAWLIVQVIKSKQDLNLLMIGVFGFSLISALFAFLDIIINMRSNTQYVRMSGLAGNANAFAFNGSVGLVLCVYYFNKTKGFTRFLLYVAITLFFTTILFSGSRGGLVFLIVSLAYLFYKLGLIKPRLFFTILPLIILFYLVWQAIPKPLEQRLVQTPDAILYGEDTWGFRLRLWESGFRLWLKSPIFGVGMDGFVARNPMGTKAVMHNMFMNILTQNGLFGFIPFVLILILTFKNLVLMEKSAAVTDEIHAMAIVWQTIFLIMILAGIKGNIEANKFTWVVIGLGISAQVNFVQQKAKAINRSQHNLTMSIPRTQSDNNIKGLS